MSGRAINARALMALMTVGVALSIAFLAWFGYRTIREWRHSSQLLDQQRADQAADLLATALSRDMRAVQSSVLSSREPGPSALHEPDDIADVVASAFARYPYPESFFVWRGRGVPAKLTFFARSSRLPPWVTRDVVRDRFPVTTIDAPELRPQITAHLEDDVRRRKRFSIFELAAGQSDYQVVTRLFYRDQFREDLEAVFGFMVNLPWVRANYFQELTGQVARIGNTHAGIRLSVTDEAGQLVAAVGAPAGGAPTTRTFPEMFFDPLLFALDSPNDLPRRLWTIQARLTDSTVAGSSITAINRTLIVAGVAAATLVLGLALTARAVRANIRLGELRSEFVSTVTHELKTPIATIRAAGDTLAGGRLSGTEAPREYAQLVVQESKRLTRLVDNLLTYSRIADVTEAYQFEALEVNDIVDEIQNEFRHQLLGGGFAVEVDILPTLPPVRADRTAVVLMLNNLVDNAIRYSRTHHCLSIRARQRGEFVALEISDRGIGIPTNEIPRVMRRFVRGRSAGNRGSGLGLPLASRIAIDHRGELTIASTVDVGTTVTVTLPVARRRA